jgi:hypothetical protein
MLVSVSCLTWQIYGSGVLQSATYTVVRGSDAAFDQEAQLQCIKKCKSLIKKQIVLKYADMVLCDMPVLSSLQRYNRKPARVHNYAAADDDIYNA